MEVLLRRLEEAIATGQFDKAAILAKELAAIKGKNGQQPAKSSSPSKAIVRRISMTELGPGPAPPPAIQPVAAPRKLVPAPVHTSAATTMPTISTTSTPSQPVSAPPKPAKRTSVEAAVRNKEPTVSPLPLPPPKEEDPGNSFQAARLDLAVRDREIETFVTPPPPHQEEEEGDKKNFGSPLQITRLESPLVNGVADVTPSSPQPKEEEAKKQSAMSLQRILFRDTSEAEVSPSSTKVPPVVMPPEPPATPAKPSSESELAPTPKTTSAVVPQDVSLPVVTRRVQKSGGGNKVDSGQQTTITYQRKSGTTADEKQPADNDNNNLINFRFCPSGFSIVPFYWPAVSDSHSCAA